MPNAALPPALGDGVSHRVTEPLITVVRSGLPLPAGAPGELVVSDVAVRAWVKTGRILRHIQRYGLARLVTERLSTAGRPMLLWPMRLMARRCRVVDAEGREREVTLGLLLRWSTQLLREAARRRRFLRDIEREIAALDSRPAARPTAATASNAPVLYLRTDLSFGVRAGGSVGHIAGVLNALVGQGPPPIMVTTAPVPTLRPEIEVHIVAAPETFWNFRELPTFVMNDVFRREVTAALGARRVSMVYQRYSLNNYAGLLLARSLRVPLILEYNGSEIWMSRHWGRPLKYEVLAERIELLNLTAADLVVVVSRAMADELTTRGLSPDRIVVNPNGVDPDRYSPRVDGSEIRRRYGLDGRIVVGFISTFQPWHGADVLASAFVRLLNAQPRFRDSVRLLMIGAGAAVARTKQILTDAGVHELAVFTSLVPQEHGPEHLAACDILASPHVPNADGSPFFGSPTKLFEYMAMGKAIVASDLDQIGEVLRHEATALLVPPADPDALARAIARLIDDAPLRRALGDAARRDAVAHHTWAAHVQRTRRALESLSAPAA